MKGIYQVPGTFFLFPIPFVFFALICSLLFFYPSHLFLRSCALSFLVITQIRGHMVGCFPPLPRRFVPCIFIARRFQFFELVDSRRIVPTHYRSGCHPFVYYPGTLRVYPDGYYPPPGPGPTQNPPCCSGRLPGYPFSSVSPWSACLTITSRNPSNTQQTSQQ